MNNFLKKEEKFFPLISPFIKEEKIYCNYYNSKLK